MPVNEYGQMIGESMEGYTPGELPSIDFLEGRYARIEALSVEKHAEDLLAVYGPDTPREMWTYLFQEPVADMEELVSLLNQMLARKDRFYYAIIDKATGKALGTFSLMRIDQNNRVIEVGAVTFFPPANEKDQPPADAAVAARAAAQIAAATPWALTGQMPHPARPPAPRHAPSTTRLPSTPGPDATPASMATNPG